MASTAAPGSATRATHAFLASRDGNVKIMGWEMTASGYAAVWAADNTRAAIFDALQRKEVCGTTGAAVVRFFGGYDWPRRARPATPLAPVTRAACRWAAILLRRRWVKTRTFSWLR